jgi:hypothetical protein
MPSPEGLWLGDEEEPGVDGNWPDEVLRPEPDDPLLAKLEEPEPDAALEADGENTRSPKRPTLTRRRAGTRNRPRKRLRIRVGTYLRRKRQLYRPIQTMSTKCQ